MALSASTLEEAFPEVNPGFQPFGEKVLIQMRVVRKKTASGLILSTETRDLNKNSTALGKVVAFGSLAYKNRNTGELWPEGYWASVGDLVRAPRYGGDRWSVPHPTDPDERIDFLVCRDIELSGKVLPEAFENIDELV